MRKMTRHLWLAVVLSLSAAAPRAQCSTLAGSGCPGTLAVQCNGAPQIGQRIAFDCPNDGRAFAQFLLVGACEPGFLGIVPPFACVAGPCQLAIQLRTLVAVSTGFAPVATMIPNDPSLVGQSLCVQCADAVARTTTCLILSEAVQLTFL